ncbi:MAG: response regulator [Desulfomonile tiedjei]|uniref:histidine kinase n=1 Tax=Desulfomonile tiedjei TaxID=2358 RepID=A0A9D6Z150_9BACT|nr:response regulator [Desulfomonile tiedjei]
MNPATPSLSQPCRDELRVLIVEDSEIDAGLVVRELQHYGYTVLSRRVDTGPALEEALEIQPWDVVLSDFAMPRFTGLEALEVVKASGLDLPFILISGTIGEEVAVEAMRAGAHDYLLKDRLARLGPAIQRELREAEGRRARKRAEQLSRRHTQELEAITRLGREISSKLSSEDIVSSVLQELVSVVKSDCAMLFLYKNNHLVLHGLESSSDEGPDREFPGHRIGECLCGISVEERRPAFSLNIHEDPRCTLEECKIAGLKSVASIPLVAGDEIMGVLALGSFREKDFSVEENFIQSLAHEITMGLRNSLLFEEVQKHAQLLEERLAELKRSNEERDSLQSQLLQAQKMEAVGILSGGIAHDFNNLLQVIQGYSDLALFHVAEGNKGHSHLREIKKAARRAAELTQALLTFSRRIESKLRPVDVNQEIRHVSAMLSRTMPKVIDIRIDLEEGIHTVNADPSQLQQVLMNLVLNARDAMPSGGTLSIQTRNLRLDEEYCRTHLGTKPGNYALVSVSDNGSGMDSKTQESIFDPFFTTKEMGKGTGLGLSIAYGIIKSHGGHIRCYSELGEGTTFRIYLPAAVEVDVKPSRTMEVEIPAGGTETVLIIDDEETLRDLASELLTKFGYRVLVAPNGKEGIKLYRERGHEIDLVILDLIMPEMGGRQCFETIFQINGSAKIVMASGYAGDGQLEDIQNLGAEAIISKPYDATELLTLVRKVLDTR